MNKKLFNIASFILALGVVSPASASLEQMVGRWINLDPETKGITKMEIEANGTKVKIHTWAECAPQDCDLGTVDGHAYSTDTYGDLGSTCRVITTHYPTRLDSGRVLQLPETLLIIRVAGPERLEAEEFARYGANDRRNNYTTTHIFKKAGNK